MQALPVWLEEKLRLSREIDKGLEDRYKGPLYFFRHHQSHAASAFYPSPFSEAAVLTMDGVGEWSTTTIGRGMDHHLELLKEIRFPHSLGLLYSAFTYYLGFRVNSGEYKVMGLAPYGKPIYADKIRNHLIDVKSDGSFWMDMRYFNYCQGLTMTNGRFHDLFGGPPHSRKRLDAAGNGPGGIDPEGMRRGDAGIGERSEESHRSGLSLHGRRMRAQLRGQRPDFAREDFQKDIRPAGGRRCRRIIGRGAHDLA